MGKRSRRRARDMKYAMGVDLAQGPDATVYYSIVRSHQDGDITIVDEVKVHAVSVDREVLPGSGRILSVDRTAERLEP